MYNQDHRIVLTLDAGGTNFVFSAIQGNREIVDPVTLPASPNDINACLDSMVRGFSMVKSQLEAEPVAISFAFPGPADYEHGVIGGNLPNFPAFRSGVALGPFLSKHFQLPVYINNDGNLFAYGEALAGMLPMVNQRLEASGNPKRYRNLLGITLGTGFGAGVVINQVLLTGDNGCGGDVWLMRNKKYPQWIAEESVSIRAVMRVYGELSGCPTEGLTPKDIFDIAEGVVAGHQEAAKQSFSELGEMAGAAIVNALDIIDGLVVIGGGVSKASKYIMPGLIKELRRSIETVEGRSFPALQMEVFDLSDADEYKRFLKPSSIEIDVPQYPGTKVIYSLEKRTAIAFSNLGASKAIALGAYAYALHQLDNQ